MAKMRYEEMLPHEFDQAMAKAPVAYVPIGTLEYHGPHLAIGNDALKATGILERACARTGGVLVPPLYWGIGGGHKGYPTSIIVRDHVLAELLTDVLEGLYRVGFRVVVLLTGHYPQEQVDAVKLAAERWAEQHPDARIWGLSEPEAYPGENRSDHAAKWETSILMHLRPELVEMQRMVGATDADAPDATRSLDEMNAPGPLHGTLGWNPARYASPELGRETVDTIVDNIAGWVASALADTAS